MALSVKRKIQFGTSFLFVLLILTGGAGVFITTTLKDESKAVLKDNYESVDYCHTMQQQLDSLNEHPALAYARFDSALVLQEHNITEPGEGPATERLRTDFNRLRSGDTSIGTFIDLHRDIQRIIFLNMHAISVKDINAQHTSKNAVTIIIALVAIVFLISFSFSYNFPSLLVNPINELTAGIKEISQKNYKHRIHIENKDEFGDLANAFNQMAERLEYFENSSINKLMFEKTRAEAVINSLKDASIGIDKDNVVLFANVLALELLALKPQDIVGKRVEEVAKFNDLFKFLVESNNLTPIKIVVNNRENYFLKEMIEVKQGDSNNKVIVMRNITSFKELDVAKTNFIATISHELKTPLAASDFSLKLLEDERIGKLTAEQRELIENLKQDNQRILKIISELLNISQVETGKLELDIQPVRPEFIIDQAIDTVAAAAREKNIRISKQLLETLPDVYADPEKTTWVLNNFLSNAIKNSNTDSEITVKTTIDKNKLTIAVTDKGIGIPKEYQTRLFERYFQVPGSKNKGSGLGLAISKEFIEAQNGSINVSSEQGEGATFSFTLPIV